MHLIVGKVTHSWSYISCGEYMNHMLIKSMMLYYLIG